MDYLNDNFNRADNDTIDGGWTETDVSNIGKILTNKLDINQTGLAGTVDFIIYQNLTQHNIIDQTFKFNLVSLTAGNDVNCNFRVRAGNARNMGYGLYLGVLNDSTITLNIYDCSTLKAGSGNVAINANQEYTIKTSIDSDNLAEVFLDGVSKVAFTNGGVPYVPVAGGSNAIMDFRDGTTDSSYAFHITIDDYLIASPTAATTPFIPKIIMM